MLRTTKCNRKKTRRWITYENARNFDEKKTITNYGFYEPGAQKRRLRTTDSYEPGAQKRRLRITKLRTFFWTVTDYELEKKLGPLRITKGNKKEFGFLRATAVTKRPRKQSN